MLRLLTILSGTINFVNCSGMKVGNIKDVYGYYNIGSYEVNYCIGKNTDMEAVIYHELGHLFWFMYMDKKYNNENFANMFSNCYMNNKCKNKLQNIILQYIYR